MSATSRHVALFLGDQLFACLFVSPLVIAFWRGTWDLIDAHFLPSQPDASVWTSLGVGLLGLLALCLLQEHFRRLAIVQYSLGWLLVCHLYAYVYAILSICHWRGLWEILDKYSGTGLMSCLSSLLIGQLVLWVFRASKCAAAPPQVVLTDISKDFFQCTSRYGTQSSSPAAYVLDHSFTLVVLSSASVLLWRGLWGIGDLYFRPDDASESALLSAAVGYSIFLLCMPLQYACNLLFKEMLKLGASRLMFIMLEDLLYCVANFGTVHLWRGVRMGMGQLILPEQPTASCIICHFCSFVALALTLTSDSVQARGFSLMGVPSKEGCFFSNHFFRLFVSAPHDAEYSQVSSAEPPPRQNIRNKIVKYRHAIVNQAAAEEDRQVLVTESSEV